MITEHDLQEAIAECQGVRNPDAKTCMMLAAFYTLQDKLFPQHNENNTEVMRYSYDAPPTPTDNTIEYQSGSEFGSIVYGRNTDEILAVMDEAMDALMVLNPSLYKSIIRKIQ